MAAELGRLDVVSLSLTILGAVLALAALGSFALIRHAAIRSAAEEAARALPDELRKPEPYAMIANLLKSDPVFLQKIADDARATSSHSADQIANVIDKDDLGKQL